MATQRLTELEDKAWRGFLVSHEHIWRELERTLAPLNVSMTEYSVLGLLGEAGRNGLRLSELAERRGMSGPGLSRLANRLEQRGLIERSRAAGDGRGYELRLTPKGESLLRKAWKLQYDDIQRLFLDRLSHDQLKALAGIWVSLADQGER
ncbi:MULTISPECIES: MarR family winged helix-turn-helix transcriptional regulator [unclassified Brevibacterium]|uniref:MarR family winged helix-turn-helix transcriptional regulator n=1 Tax=unclassified Brevibacterium TaxID=2614124 RepID=UPI0010918FE9|nr:MarR family transcriptional regulator [Brevibacterium sp. S22]TGD32614.1 MarR family transcriptional regulator [Brevibacterium sp. S22]